VDMFWATEQFVNDFVGLVGVQACEGYSKLSKTIFLRNQKKLEDRVCALQILFCSRFYFVSDSSLFLEK
jgi:hypothetical protein